MAFPVFIPATGAFVSFILFFLAWRGRRIDDHPLCRNCQFDLIGLPADADKCSECGANLKQRRAIRVGHRRVRRGWLLTALGLILGCAAWLTIIGREYTASHDMTAYKPTWWLLADARGSVAKRDAALSRLLQRLRDKKLNSSQTHTVIGLILAAQADPKRAWNKDWGRTLEDLRNENVVSDQEWHTYWRQAMSLTLLVPQKIYKDEDLHVLLLSTPPMKDSGRYQLSILSLAPVSIGDVPLVARDDPYSAGIRRASLKIPLEGVAARVSGAQTLRVMAKIERSATGRAWIFFETKTELEPLMIPVEARLTLLPSKILTKAEIEAQLIQCMHLQPITIRRRRGTVEEIASLTIKMNNPSVAVAFSVFIRQSDFEWPMGQLICARRQNLEVHLEGPVDNIERSEAYLILRPQIPPAAGGEPVEIWEDPIVISKIPVKDR